MSGCNNGCRTPCKCENKPRPMVQMADGTTVEVARAGGSGQRLCSAVAGGQASLTIGGVPAPIPAGALGYIRISVSNYSWLAPEKLTMTVADPAAPGVNPSATVRVLEVKAIGRQVIGSVQGISAQSIDSQSQNYLDFGSDISDITSSNFIDIIVRNDSAVDLNIMADVDGEGSQ